MNYFTKGGQSHIHISPDDLRESPGKLRAYLDSLEPTFSDTVVVHAGPSGEVTAGLIALALTLARHVKQGGRRVALDVDNETAEILRPLGVARIMELAG